MIFILLNDIWWNDNFQGRVAHLDLIEGVVVDLLQTKWKSFIKRTFFRQIFTFFIYFLRFEFFCGNTIVLLKLCVENSKTKIYLSNQHLAKENENVSWTAKKLCHHTYHAIHSINIRIESKLLAPVVYFTELVETDS